MVRRALRGLLSDDEAARRRLLTAVSEAGHPGFPGFLEALESGNVYLWGEEVVICRDLSDDGKGGQTAALLDPLTREPVLRAGAPVVVPAGEIQEPELSRRARLGLIRDAKLLVDAASPDAEKRISTLVRMGDLRERGYLPLIEERLKTEREASVRRVARETAALIRLGAGLQEGDRDELKSAAEELGELRSARGVPVLEEALKELEKATDPAQLPLRKACADALRRIESYQTFVRGFEHLFSGLSLGSILVLMALGLSITFGLMGVINMAHGELMMIGAYATFETQQLFLAHLPPGAFDLYYLAALPASFLASAAAGYLIEVLVIRHLYGRPLETLLATWGIALILIQLVRVRYGDNISVNNPTWLRGGFEVMSGVTLPYNRCFILLLCASSVLLVYLLMNFTRLGLLVRATMQNRETASSLGVNTRRVDGSTFALGSGIAGVAGCALTLIGGVTPDMGQNYIVDSFLVVVTGGVGELAGVISSGLGLGILNKILEAFSGAVFGKVLILLLVVFFIQWRPAGLFPPKGRLADD